MRARLYADVVRERYERLCGLRRRKLAGEDVQLFVPTGLSEWDKNGGIPYEVLTVIGAGTGEGKSILKLHLARAAALTGLKVLVIDQEDPPDKTADRSLATESLLDSKAIGLLNFDDVAEERLAAATMDVDGWGNNVYYYAGLLLPEQAKELWREHSDAAVVLTDYLQAILTPRGSSKEEAIRIHTQDMNLDAQDTDTHVKRAHVAFSQLTGDVEEQGDKRLEYSRRTGRPDISGYRPGPGTGHLAWSQSIGHNAKLTGYWWRPGRWERRAGISGAKDNRGELLFPKANFGDEGRIQVGFDGPTARLFDMERT